MNTGGIIAVATMLAIAIAAATGRPGDAQEPVGLSGPQSLIDTNPAAPSSAPQPANANQPKPEVLQPPGTDASSSAPQPASANEYGVIKDGEGRTAEPVKKTPTDIKHALQESDGITVMMGLRNILLPILEGTDLSRLAETIFEATKRNEQITLHFGRVGKDKNLLIAAQQDKAEPIVAAILKELLATSPDTADKKPAPGNAARPFQEYEALEREAAALAEQYRRHSGTQPKPAKEESAPAAREPKSTTGLSHFHDPHGSTPAARAQEHRSRWTDDSEDPVEWRAFILGERRQRRSLSADHTRRVA